MKKIKGITINTDASFHPSKTGAGYAFYIICDLFKIQKGGMFKKLPINSEDAEMMCIGNAVATLLAQKELPKAMFIVINSDCVGAMKKIEAGKKSLAKQIFGLLNKLKEKTSAKVYLKHVKAHSDNKDARSYVNNWCDSEAKKWMKLSIKKNDRIRENNT